MLLSQSRQPWHGIAGYWTYSERQRSQVALVLGEPDLEALKR